MLISSLDISSSFVSVHNFYSSHSQRLSLTLHEDFTNGFYMTNGTRHYHLHEQSAISSQYIQNLDLSYYGPWARPYHGQLF